MKHVDVEALVEQATKIPVKMDRAAKLKHWAGLVRQYQGTLGLYHLLEALSPAQLKDARCDGDQTALGIAVRDPVLREQGLTDTSVAGVMGFMEITQADLHEFSCNCGGAISNKDQAARIEKLAGGGGGPVSRVVNGITRMMSR
jgi:hypothetical protein